MNFIRLENSSWGALFKWNQQVNTQISVHILFPVAPKKWGNLLFPLDLYHRHSGLTFAIKNLFIRSLRTSINHLSHSSFRDKGAMSSSSGNATDQTENTPLLAASQTTDEVSPRLIYNPSLWLMGFIFFFGASTGGYLLYIQGELLSLVYLNLRYLNHPVLHQVRTIRYQSPSSSFDEPTGDQRRPDRLDRPTTTQNFHSAAFW